LYVPICGRVMDASLRGSTLRLALTAFLRFGWHTAQNGEDDMKNRFGRVALGLGVIVGLAGIVGLESTIEAKPPSDSSGSLRDLDLPAARAPRVATSPRLDTLPVMSPVTLPAPERVASVPAQLRTAVPATQGGRFELTGAEKLSIKFHGHQDLSGDYRVNPDESVSVPALGRMSIAGLSAAEFESALADRAAKLTGRESYITVEVAEYRPVFVSGLVQRPGSHPWQPGMTVLHAVTLLGGLYRATSENAGGVVIGADAEILRLRRNINDLKRNQALLARFRAERANQAVIEVPETLIALVGRTEAQSLVAEQTSVLANRRSGLSSQLAALERAKAIATQEMAGLVEQSKRLREMLEQRRTYKKQMDTLQAKGVVTTTRTMEEQGRLVELEDRATTVSVGIARVQGTMASLERDIISLRQERLAEIDTEIFKLNKENAQLELEIEGARNAYFKITGTQAPMQFVERDAPKSAIVEYQLVRYEAGVQQSKKVDQFARLKPGDILIVDVQKD
jgi:exopolysaccharide production protein ExoF